MINERRKFPRRPVNNATMGLPIGIDVRILDLSLNGVLMQVSRPLDPGTVARLRLAVAGAQFAADITIRRVAPLPNGLNGFRIGAQFINPSSETRDAISALIANS